MSYKANFINKLIKKLRGVRSSEFVVRSKKNNLSDHVGKWLAGEGRNFITMATL